MTGNELKLLMHDFRYVHTDGRERLGLTPPSPPEGWTKQTRDVYVTPWRDDPSPWPRRVKLDFADLRITNDD